MATDFGKYVTQAILNVFRGTTFPSVPANFYVALLTTMPTASDGTGLVEVSGGSYARVAMATAAGTWVAPAVQGDSVTYLISNVAAVTFATASANWGTILGVAFYDASSGTTNLWGFGTLTTNQTVNSGSQFSFPIGNLTVTAK
jgi:hypothetical protein